MAKLVVNKLRASCLTTKQIDEAVKLCPFGAIEFEDGGLCINDACRTCKLCVDKGVKGVFEFVPDDMVSEIDKSLYCGIAVYIDNAEGRIHPVSLELLGKARELADKINHPVYALLIGHSIDDVARELLHYGIDEIFTYDCEKLAAFSIEPYTNVFEDFIKKTRPSSILIGATTTGRSLAPRVAARCQTGLTADCTKLDIKKNTDLVQIRPAFGGNIMAQISTPNHRPQIATVRYKVFSVPERKSEKHGKVSVCEIGDDKLAARVKVITNLKKEKKKSISDADVIIAVGRGVRSQNDIAMAYELANLLGGEVAATRPVVEAGWIEPSRQIGLSGRTVKPRLIITLGISGSVQFRAGMENSDVIISINNDENAQIFNVSHYAIVGDIYEVVPKLIERICKGEQDELL